MPGTSWGHKQYNNNLTPSPQPSLLLPLALPLLLPVSRPLWLSVWVVTQAYLLEYIDRSSTYLKHYELHCLMFCHHAVIIKLFKITVPPTSVNKHLSPCICMSIRKQVSAKCKHVCQLTQSENTFCLFWFFVASDSLQSKYESDSELSSVVLAPSQHPPSWGKAKWRVSNSL